MAEKCYKQPKTLQIVPYAVWDTQTPWELGCVASTPNTMMTCKNMLDWLAPCQIN